MVHGDVEVRWSTSALRDLDRFAAFLIDNNPRLASVIAQAIMDSAEALASHPLMGRPIDGGRFRQVVVIVENASYVIQYRFEKLCVTILRVRHSREEF